MLKGAPANGTATGIEARWRPRRPKAMRLTHNFGLEESNTTGEIGRSGFGTQRALENSILKSVRKLAEVWIITPLIIINGITSFVRQSVSFQMAPVAAFWK